MNEPLLVMLLGLLLIVAALVLGFTTRHTPQTTSELPQPSACRAVDQEDLEHQQTAEVPPEPATEASEEHRVAEVPAEGSGEARDTPAEQVAASTEAAGVDPTLQETEAAKSANPAPTPAAETERFPAAALDPLKKRHKEWAEAEHFEYTKVDTALAADWSNEILGLEGSQASADSEKQRSLHHVVSGFYGGHQTHIAEHNKAMIVAMRRPQISPVRVMFARATHAEQPISAPAGMRHVRDCDLPPFQAFASDTRALIRMLDERVTQSLDELADVAACVEFSHRWVIVRTTRKLAPGGWNALLAAVLPLAHASMVLPPEILNAVLDMDVADPTRQIGRLRISTLRPGDREETAEASGGDEAPRQTVEHLQVVSERKRHPAGKEDGEVATAAAAEEATEETPTGAAVKATEGAPVDAPQNAAGQTPPDVPHRATGKSAGDTTAFADSSLTQLSRGQIPKLGEDPEHSQARHTDRPVTVAPNAHHEPTIFRDTLEDHDVVDHDVVERHNDVLEADRLHSERLVPSPQRVGKHRAADHKRAAPEDPVIVEAEVVDLDQRRQQRNSPNT